MKIADLPIGTKVREIRSDIVFLVAEIDHAGCPGTALISEKVLMQACLDAPEPENTSTERRLFGSNDYVLSNLHQYLNATGDGCGWFLPSTPTDTAPDKAHVLDGKQAYAEKAGFLSGFGERFAAALQDCELPYSRSPGCVETFTAKVFLPSLEEIGVGCVAADHEKEGTMFRLFKDFRTRYALPSKKALEESELGYGVFVPEDSWCCWLRSSHPKHACAQYVVHSHSPYVFYGANRVHVGVRPMCCVSSELEAEPAADGYMIR